MQVTQEYIYIYIYTLNPVESNHRDGPTGHKKRTTYLEEKVSLWLLCGVQHSVIMADFLMPETHPIIVIIFIIIIIIILLTFKLFL